MADGKIVNTWVSDDKDMLRSIERMNRQITKLQDKLRRSGTESKASSRKVSSGFTEATNAAKGFATALGAGAGVGGALALVNKALDAWINKVKMLSTMGRTGHEAATAFASLQPAGKKAGRLASAVALMGKYGEKDSAQGLDMIQAMQSISRAKTEEGRAREGMQAAEMIYRGTRIGVPTEVGKEVEILSRSLGLDAGVGLRRVHVAGEESGRTPETLAAAVAGMRFFGAEQKLGIAAAAEIASGVTATQAPTFVKASGDVLGEMDPSKPEFKMFKKLGAEKLNRAGRLQALAKAGIDEPGELSVAGVGNIRGQQGVSILVQNLAKISQRLDVITEQAVPGYMRRKRGEMEVDIPSFGVVRRADEARARTRLQREFGGRELEAGAQMAERGAGRASTRRDFNLYGMPFVDEAGDETAAGVYDRMIQRVWNWLESTDPNPPGGGVGGAPPLTRPVFADKNEILKELQKQTKARTSVRQDQ